MEGPWTRDEASASGSVFEDRVWALLMEQSRGHLHVFRPLLDRGVDALLHRLADGAYIPVQAKGRTSVERDGVHINVRAETITDDLVVIIGGEVVDGGVGPMMLVVPTADFRRLALLTTAGGVPEYSMSFSLKPESHSRWQPWLVPSDRLVERFGVPLGLAELAIAEVRPPLRRSPLGFLGDAEVIRRLAEAEHLNLFRPFPDLETVELAVRHLKNGHVVGLQIKTVSVEAVRQNRHDRPVDISIASFRPAPTTYFTVVAWMPEERRFHEECLVFPSEDLLQFARADGLHYIFTYHPGSTTQRRLDKYRRPLSDLSGEIESLL
jgi:hypothetical protein